MKGTSQHCVSDLTFGLNFSMTYHSGQKVLESIGREVHVVHEAEQLLVTKNASQQIVTAIIRSNILEAHPNFLVNKTLAQTLPYT
jgi:hypothetical protein